MNATPYLEHPAVDPAYFATESSDEESGAYVIAQLSGKELAAHIDDLRQKLDEANRVMTLLRHQLQGKVKQLEICQAERDQFKLKADMARVHHTVRMGSMQGVMNAARETALNVGSLTHPHYRYYSGVLYGLMLSHGNEEANQAYSAGFRELCELQKPAYVASLKEKA